MNFVTEYVISIITVALLALLLEQILPEGNNKKYLLTVIGLLVMIVILGPLTKLPHYSETFVIPYLRLSDQELTIPKPQPYLAETFEENLSETISRDLLHTFNKEIHCRVVAESNDEGQITRINVVQLNPYDAEADGYITEKYGLEKGVVRP